jgi:hypothetical protein
VGVYYRKSKSIKELRERIIDAVHLFCEKCKMRKVSGWCSAGEECIPHLTFTRLEQYTPSGLKGIKELDFSFQASTIGIFYLGTYGTCRKLVTYFDF